MTSLLFDTICSLTAPAENHIPDTNIKKNSRTPLVNSPFTVFEPVATVLPESLCLNTTMDENALAALHNLTTQLATNAQRTDDRFTQFAERIGTSMGSNGLAPVQPKPFSGSTNTDIFAFLTKFDRFAAFFAWDEPKRLQALPLFLEGRALGFYDTLPEQTRNSFQLLQAALRNHFSPPSLRMLERTALNQRRMREGETLDTYTDDVNAKCRRLNLADADCLQIFVQGLKNDLKEYVLLQQPLTFLEAQNAAQLKQAASQSVSTNTSLENLITDSVRKIQLSNSVAALQPQPSEVSELKREINSLRSQLRNLTMEQHDYNTRKNGYSFRNNGRGGKTQLTCFRCNRAGHIMRDCYANISHETPRHTSHNNNRLNTNYVPNQPQRPPTSRNNTYNSSNYFRNDAPSRQVPFNIPSPCHPGITLLKFPHLNKQGSMISLIITGTPMKNVFSHLRNCLHYLMHIPTTVISPLSSLKNHMILCQLIALTF